MKRMWSKNELNKIIATLVASGSLPSIKRDEIIENMSGYSFTLPEDNPKVTLDYIYAGACKNGNKLTLVIYFKITRNDSIGTRINIGEFTLPDEVMEKLITSSIFGEQLLSADFISATDETDVASKSIMIVCGKSTNSVYFAISTGTMANLVQGNSNVVRIEKTFLLSDNLIPAGE